MDRRASASRQGRWTMATVFLDGKFRMGDDARVSAFDGVSARGRSLRDMHGGTGRSDSAGVPARGAHGTPWRFGARAWAEAIRCGCRQQRTRCSRRCGGGGDEQLESAIERDGRRLEHAGATRWVARAAWARDTRRAADDPDRGAACDHYRRMFEQGVRVTTADKGPTRWTRWPRG